MNGLLDWTPQCHITSDVQSISHIRLGQEELRINICWVKMAPLRSAHIVDIKNDVCVVPELKPRQRDAYNP